MVILVLVSMYLPGYKAGGPIQSVANMTEQLGEGFQIRIITSDRDLGDSQPYPTVEPGEWQQIGKAQVLYVRPADCSIWNLRSIINSTAYDLLYLNSLFNPVFTLFPLLLWQAGMLRRTPLVIAPRGELSPGALQIKSLRKRLYLGVARALHLHSGVLWQATGLSEEAEIRLSFPGESSTSEMVVVAPDLLSLGFVNEDECKREKKRAAICGSYLHRGLVQRRIWQARSDVWTGCRAQLTSIFAARWMMGRIGKTVEEPWETCRAT